MLDSTTAIQIAGKDVWEEKLQERYGRDGSSATWTLLCRWADRAVVISYLRGTIMTPGVYTYNSNLLFSDCTVEPQAGDTQGSGDPAHKYARLTVQYATLPWNPADLGGLTFDFTTEALSLSGTQAALKWASDDADVDSSVQQVMYVGTVAFSIKRRNISTIDLATIVAAATTVNSATFQGAGAGYVLFDGAYSNMRALAPIAPNEVWGSVSDIELRFRARTIPWNQFYRPGAGWQAVKRKDNNGDWYASSDHNALLAMT